MSRTLVQSASAEGADSSTSVTATFGAAATVGHIIWCAVGIDKTSGTITPPSGFTEIVSQDSASVSTWVGYKISTGGEAAITLSHATVSPMGDTMWIGEYSDTAGSDWAILGSAWDLTNETTRTVTPSGTTGATSAQGQGLAFFTIDSGLSNSGTPTYTNSYINIKNYLSSGNGGVAVAALADVASGTTATTTQTHSPTADQTSGVIVVFAAAPPPSLMSLFPVRSGL